MRNQLSPEQLIESEARCARATLGPWRSYVEGRDHSSGDSFIRTGGNDIYLTGASAYDQDFIANARQDIPMLIAEVRRLHDVLRSRG
jgi:hypothetical protein